MKSWFVFAHIIDSFEKDDYNKIFKKCKKNLSKDTDVYVLRIYNKRIARIYHYTQNHEEIILHSRQLKMSRGRWISGLVKFVKDKVKENGSKIHALSYYGHGGSVVVGRWQDPFMGIAEFTKLVIKPIKPTLMAMDSCYMAAITSLYEFAPYCKYVLASPSWHPYASVSQVPMFGKLPISDSDADWKTYAIKLARQFQNLESNPKYTCLIPFDISGLRDTIKKIKTLYLTKESTLKLNDKQQYDLYLSVDKSLKKSILKTVLCWKCVEKCPERVYGISVREPDPEDAWHKHFLKTKWSKVLDRIKIVREPQSVKK